MVDGDGVAFWKRNAHTKTHMKCDVHKQSSSGASHTLIRHTHTHARTPTVCFYVCIETRDADQKLISLEKAIS